MGLELIAIAGILMLGAGVMILVANLRKERSATGMLDQIGTDGYVAEAARGASESPGRRPLDRWSSVRGFFKVTASLGETSRRFSDTIE